MFAYVWNNSIHLGDNNNSLQSLELENDILFLQETWLRPNEMDMLNNVNPEFSSFSMSSIDVHNDILTGRPYGGLSILWNKQFSPVCEIVNFDDTLILGISILCGTVKYLIINVYLPYYCNDNYPEYMMYMGKLASMWMDKAGVHFQ